MRRRRREQILLGAALAALGLGLGLGHVVARATGGGVDAGLSAAGKLELAAGVTTPSPMVPAASSTAPAAPSTAESTGSSGSAGSTASLSAPTATTTSTPGAVAPSATARGLSTTTTAVPSSATSSPTATSPPSTRPATVATPPPAAGLTRLEQGVLDAVNAARQLAGCQPLAVDPALQAAAHAYAGLMVDQHWFDHRSPNGQSPTDRARAAGYQGGVGENLMMGFKDDPAGAVNDPRYGWLQSDGHRANILNCDYRRTGVGYDPGNIQSGYADGSWVQMFG